MQIGFDVSQTSEQKAGCGFFADQLVRSLMKIDQSNQYTLYPAFYSYIPQYKDIFKNGYYHLPGNFKNHFSIYNPFDFLRVRFWWQEPVPDRTRWLGSVDVVHSNNFSCIKDHQSKIVFTLYDAAPLVHPEFTTEANWIVCSKGLFNASLHADFCVAISEYTKKTFLEYFPYYPENRIKVIPLGVRDQIQRITDPETIKRTLSQYQIQGDFWLSAGTVEPRKNYGTLIEAYAQTSQKLPLVIAGGKGWMQSELPEKIKQLGLENKVKFLGYVSDQELSALYAACHAFIYPSFYEGFGLPVLEAMHCGAPVICSKTSSLPEVGGDAVLYIDPKSKESLVQAMNEMEQNLSLRDSLKRSGLERSKNFSWDKTARSVLDVYEQVIKLPSYDN